MIRPKTNAWNRRDRAANAAAKHRISQDQLAPAPTTALGKPQSPCGPKLTSAMPSPRQNAS
jgi:hypothetical protein